MAFQITIHWRKQPSEPEKILAEGFSEKDAVEKEVSSCWKERVDEILYVRTERSQNLYAVRIDDDKVEARIATKDYRF